MYLLVIYRKPSKALRAKFTRQKRLIYTSHLTINITNPNRSFNSNRRSSPSSVTLKPYV